VPILIIFICNFLIIFRTIQSDKQRRNLKIIKQIPSKKSQIIALPMHVDANTIPLKKSSKQQFKLTDCATNASVNKNKSVHVLHSNNKSTQSISNNSNVSYRIKPYYLNHTVSSKKMTNQANNLNKISRILMLISFMYAILNLPYLISWSVYFYETTFQIESKVESSNYLFSALQITEVFYMLNYGLMFYVNFMSGSLFRNQIRLACKFFLFLFNYYLFFFSFRILFTQFFKLVKIRNKNLLKFNFT